MKILAETDNYRVIVPDEWDSKGRSVIDMKIFKRRQDEFKNEFWVEDTLDKCSFGSFVTAFADLLVKLK